MWRLLEQYRVNCSYNFIVFSVLSECYIRPSLPNLSKLSWFKTFRKFRKSEMNMGSILQFGSSRVKFCSYWFLWYPSFEDIRNLSVNNIFLLLFVWVSTRLLLFFYNLIWDFKSHTKIEQSKIKPKQCFNCMIGSQPVLELLRELMDRKGCYDPKRLIFLSLTGINFVAAATSPGVQGKSRGNSLKLTFLH